jgi:hypothetical protein
LKCASCHHGELENVDMGSSSKDKAEQKSAPKDALKLDDAKFKDKKDKHKAKEEGKVKEKKEKDEGKVKEKKSKEEKHKGKEEKHKEEKRDKKDKSHKQPAASSSPALNAINSKRSAPDAPPALPSNSKKQKADDGLAVPRRSPRLSAASPKIAPAMPSLALGGGLALAPAILDSQTPQEFRAANQITVTGLGDGVLVPAPLTKFSQTPFAPNIRKSLEAAGFPSPTATQAQVTAPAPPTPPPPSPHPDVPAAAFPPWKDQSQLYISSHILACH